MVLIQLTGLSGAGKTSIAFRVQQLLLQRDIAAQIIDGDAYRQTVCKDLGFTPADRRENIRRLGAIAHDIVQQNTIAIIAAINPYEEVRQELRAQYNAHTVWIHCSLDVLVERDTKGLYKRALLPVGHPERVNNLTGVNDSYDIPIRADLVIYTHSEDLETSSVRLFAFILDHLLNGGS
ncbi:adenylyl-sulfate kinase [Paraflavitalea sp. CAU 1676]|uniref:adenylyl-sulfate kinase n=1 Tax=Paraflavitalea sp. CAU 1676 TaxID=3032598 RepID=UPI0023DC6CDC|nr:adenylyl-sulfate kinase [Paraflavitalea sp. CAU 1676]MDF2186945.1 adenylyl-sulfate kinase [Paraflavitalea sp. CAU 1676]